MSTVTCYVGTTTITCELQEAPKTPKAFGDGTAQVWPELIKFASRQ